jgi:hypothetical protein
VKAERLAGHSITSKDWNIPMSKALKLIEPQNKSRYARYVSYRVSVSFEGRSRIYNAMALFGEGEVPILILDNIINKSALMFVPNKSLHPAILMETNLTEKATISGWLKSHQMPDSACTVQMDVCCDTSTLTCGVPESMVKANTNKPITGVIEPRSLFAETRSGPSAHFVTVTVVPWFVYADRKIPA